MNLKHSLLILSLIFLTACGGGGGGGSPADDDAANSGDTPENQNTDKETQNNNSGEGSTGNKETQGNVDNNVTDLLGTWERVCMSVGNTHFIVTSSFSSLGEMITKQVFYEDENCTVENGDTNYVQSNYRIGEEITTTDGVTARKIDFDLKQTVFNGVKQDPFPITSYAIYLVQGETYYQANFNGVVPIIETNRPTTLDYDNYYIKTSNDVLLKMPSGSETGNSGEPTQGENGTDSSNAPLPTPKDYPLECGTLSLSGPDTQAFGDAYRPQMINHSGLGCSSSPSGTSSSYSWSEARMETILNPDAFSSKAFGIQVFSGKFGNVGIRLVSVNKGSYFYGIDCGGLFADFVTNIQYDDCSAIKIDEDNQTVTLTNLELKPLDIKDNKATDKITLDGTLKFKVTEKIEVF